MNFAAFARNSLIRDMTFRTNFIIECISSLSWMFMNVGLYLIIFGYTSSLGEGTGWGKYQFFVFLSTTLFVNSIVQAFFMPNIEEFSELIRTGNLDFALLKPIDTQFLVSLRRVQWSSLGNLPVGVGLLIFSMWTLATREEDPLEINPVALVLYPLYVACGVAILYSLMIALAIHLLELLIVALVFIGFGEAEHREACVVVAIEGIGLAHSAVFLDFPFDILQPLGDPRFIRRAAGAEHAGENQGGHSRAGLLAEGAISRLAFALQKLDPGGDSLFISLGINPRFAGLGSSERREADRQPTQNDR